MKFNTDIKDKIILYSHGLAAITHELCLMICENRGVVETSDEEIEFNDGDLENAIEDYIHEYSDSLKLIYDTATKTKNKRKFEEPKNILEALINSGKEEASINDIASEMQKKMHGYKPTNLKRYVDELTTSDRNEILRFNKDNYCYSFSSPFLKAYANFIIHKQNGEQPITGKGLIKELKQFILDTFESNMILNPNYDPLDDDDDLPEFE